MCQTRRRPSRGQGERMPFSVETLLPVGPRKAGQSLPGRPTAGSAAFAALTRTPTHNNAAVRMIRILAVGEHGRAVLLLYTRRGGMRRGRVDCGVEMMESGVQARNVNG